MAYSSRFGLALSLALCAGTAYASAPVGVLNAAPRSAKPLILGPIQVGNDPYPFSWHKGNLWEFALPGESTAGAWTRMFAIREMKKGSAKDLDSILARHELGARNMGAEVLLSRTLPKTKSEPAVRVLVNTHPPQNGEPGELTIFAIRGRAGRALVTWMAIRFTTQAEVDGLQEGSNMQRLVAQVAAAKLPSEQALHAIPVSRDP